MDTYDEHPRAFYLGARDWCFPHWPGAFYPEDMPAEWRMAYYNTHYSCLWLAHAVWCRLTPATIAEWLADSRADFRFVLEAGDLATPGEASLAAAFGDKLGMLCRADDPALVWFQAGVDLRALAETLRARARGDGDIYVLSADGDLTTLERVGILLGLLDVGQGSRVG